MLKGLGAIAMAKVRATPGVQRSLPRWFSRHGSWLLRNFFLGAGLLLCATVASAASPDQHYLTWQKTYLRDPDTAEKAAQEYLRAAPQGPYAADLQIWLDAYHKAMAGILSQPRTANKGAPADKQASARPAPPLVQPVPPPAQPVPPAQPLRVLADAYHKALASILTQPRTANRAMPANKQASAQSAAPAPPPKIVAQEKPPMPAALNPPKTLPVPPPISLPVQPRQPAPADVRLASAMPALPRQAAPQPVKLAAVPPVPAQRPDTGPETRLASAVPSLRQPSPRPPPKDYSAPPPGEKPLGQSLDDMLAFIADKVEGQGRLNFTAQFFSPSGGALVEQLSYQASNVTIDPNRCQVFYHWHVQQDGRSTPDQDRAVQFRLSKAMTVETVDQALGDINAGRFTVHVNPELYAVHITRWDKPAGDNLYFRDRGMADSVAAAAQHALDLCDKGGR